MESGLEGRNNLKAWPMQLLTRTCLNGVRPRRPEQFVGHLGVQNLDTVSMESGLEGRNNYVDENMTAHLDPSQWSPA